MQKDPKGFSLIDFILGLIIVGVLGYVAMQCYFKWSESFRGQEAADQLKKVKSQVEVCAYVKSDISNCLANVENVNTLHFKCCDGKKIPTKDNSTSYLLYATRNDNDMSVVDEGGIQPACPSDSKGIHREKSGVGLCRNSDGTFIVQGWGIYKGTF